MRPYLEKDIVNALRAVASADRSAQSAYFDKESASQGAYHYGFAEALKAVGLAFGLESMIDQKGDRGPIWIEGITSE